MRRTIQSTNATVDGINSNLNINYDNFIDEATGVVKRFKSGALSYDNGKEMLRKYIERRDNELDSLNWPIPNTMSELFEFLEAYAGNNDQWNQPNRYYFPLYSYAHLYSPETNENEQILDKFKKGNWYIPTMFELSTILLYKVLKNEEGYSYFKDAMNRGLISTGNVGPGTQWIATCNTGSDDGTLARCSYNNGVAQANCSYTREDVRGKRYVTHLCCNF